VNLAVPSHSDTVTVTVHCHATTQVAMAMAHGPRDAEPPEVRGRSGLGGLGLGGLREYPLCV